jgi:hypothetical protein
VSASSWQVHQLLLQQCSVRNQNGITMGEMTEMRHSTMVARLVCRLLFVYVLPACRLLMWLLLTALSLRTLRPALRAAGRWSRHAESSKLALRLSTLL